MSVSVVKGNQLVGERSLKEEVDFVIIYVGPDVARFFTSAVLNQPNTSLNKSVRPYIVTRCFTVS